MQLQFSYVFKFVECFFDQYYDITQDLFTDHAVDLLRNQSAVDPSDRRPLFLYLAFQNVHVPNEVPDKYTALYGNIKPRNHMEKERKTHMGK